MPMISYECRHIMPSGSKCGSIALKDKPYCYAHTRLHRAMAAPPPGPMDSLHFPVLEDRHVIQIAVSQVLNSLCSGSLDPRRVGLALYGLQIASQNVDRTGDVIPFGTVESVTETESGDELAPIEHICDPSKCFVCPERDSCEEALLTDEEQERAIAQIRKRAVERRAMAAANRPKPAGQSAVSAAQSPPSPAPCALPAVNGTLPIVHAAASPAHRPLVHCTLSTEPVPRTWRQGNAAHPCEPPASVCSTQWPAPCSGLPHRRCLRPKLRCPQ